MFFRQKKSYRGNQKSVRKKIQQRQLKKKWFRIFGRAGSFESAKKSFKPMLIGVFFLMIMAGFVAFALFSPYFLIQEVSIERDTPFVDADGIKNVLGDVYGSNLLFFDKAEATQFLQEAFPEMISVVFTEQWPHTLKVTVNMSVPQFTLFNTETADFATVSENGIVLNYDPDIELPTIKFTQYPKPIAPRDKVISHEYLQSILDTKQFLETELSLTVKEIMYLYTAREVHFTVFPSDAVVWIDLQADTRSQLKKLQLAADNIGLYNKQIHHIDLRIPGQIFWENR